MILEPGPAQFLLQLVWQQLWIGAAAVLVVGLCLRTTARLNSATRHWVWALTLLAVALLPLPSLIPGAAAPQSAHLPDQQKAHAPLSGADERAMIVTPDSTGRSATPDTATLAGTIVAGEKSVRWAATSLMALWCAGTSWMLLCLLRGAQVAARMRRQSAAAPFRSDLAELRLSNEAGSPMVVGFRHPSILIPASLLEDMSRGELERILAHELAHVRRRDQWLMLVQRVIEAIWFFHPAIRFAARHLDHEREISCDDRAAAGQRISYANSLVRICTAIVSNPAPAPLAVGAVRTPNQLSHRIACLLDNNRNHAPDVSRKSIALVSVVWIGAMISAAEFMPRIATADGLQADSAAALADPDILVPGDASAMMRAAARDDIALLEQLLAAGGNVNHRTPGDGTPLIAAARHGNRVAAEWLLDHGADANLALRGDANPLIVAAAGGHTDVLRLLLDRGADVDAIVPGDETALISSARSGAIESVRLLLEHGADVDLAVPGGGLLGASEMRTALNQAQARGHEDVAALLAAYGARR